ncbi:hypothetical protein D3C80_1448030 [compost metagenome]
MLVDHDVTGLWGQSVYDLDSGCARAVGSWSALVVDRLADCQITALGIIDVSGVEQRYVLTAGAVHQLHSVIDHLVEPQQREAVFLLHVDHENSGV